MVEEMLLSPVLHVKSVFKLKTGQIIHRGYVANLRQESAAFIDEVPCLADLIPFIIVKCNGQGNTSVNCKVNRARVQGYKKFGTAPPGIREEEYYIQPGKLQLATRK